MRDDTAYLLDILIAARDAREFVADLTWDQFEVSRLHQSALVKVIEIIGEAAATVSEETRTAYPDVPWREMVGMRHRLVHGYFEIDLRKVRDAAHRDLPVLIALVEPLIAPDEP